MESVSRLHRTNRRETRSVGEVKVSFLKTPILKQIYPNSRNYRGSKQSIIIGFCPTFGDYLRKFISKVPPMKEIIIQRLVNSSVSRSNLNTTQAARPETKDQNKAVKKGLELVMFVVRLVKNQILAQTRSL